MKEKIRINKDQKMIYLATAYSCTKYRLQLINRLVMWWRYHKVSKLAAKLMKQGNIVFSPITHSHVVAIKGKMDSLSHSFWLSQDFWYVKRCDELHVLKHHSIDWLSVGVRREVEWATCMNKPIVYHEAR